MIQLLEGGVYLVDGRELIPDDAQAAGVLKDRLGDVYKRQQSLGEQPASRDRAQLSETL